MTLLETRIALQDPKTVIVMGTMDTKGPELIYLAQRVEAAGCRARLMDVGASGMERLPVETGIRDTTAAFARLELHPSLRT